MQNPNIWPESVQTVLANIRDRRTLPFVRMSDAPIAPEILDALLEAANWAPTHRYTEPWRFTLFEGEGRMHLSNTLGEAYRDFVGDKFDERKFEKTRTRAMTLPVTLAIHMTRNPIVPEWEEMMAVGCAIQNLHLAAQAFGIGGAWSSPGYCEHQEVRKLLELKEDERCFGFFYLGYPKADDCWPVSKRGPVVEKVRRVTA